MRKIIYIVLAVLLVLSIPALAAQKVGTFGVPNSSGTAPLEVDSDGILSISTDSGLKTNYERATASDTLTAADSGKTISVSCPATTCEFDLPEAEAGMFFRFTSETKNGFIVDPDSSDAIRWNGVGGSGVLAAGAPLRGTGDTYSTLTIYSTQDNYWTVETLSGFVAY